MLLHFSVSNYSSIKDEVVLSMIPAKSKLKNDHIIHDEEGKSVKALPIACIYGANASGKTNFIKAISFAKKFILNGTKVDDPINRIAHLLDPESEKKKSKFEFIFKFKGVLYNYGFLVDDKYVYEEWLFAHYTAYESLLFERKTENEFCIVNPGKRLTENNGVQFIEFIAKSTRPNQLFLTECNEKNIQILKPVLDWFKTHLIVISADSNYANLAPRAFSEKAFCDYLSDALKLADTGIKSIYVEEESVDFDTLFKDAPDGLRQALTSIASESTDLVGEAGTLSIRKDNNVNGGLKVFRLMTNHIRSDGSPVGLSASSESDGTRRWMNLVPAFYDSHHDENVYIIDELDRSMHTMLTRMFLNLCITGAIEKRYKRQFIFTTHDTNLLDRELLRKDEIWFTEKDSNGATHLTSLVDYNVSEGLNYENGYLSGRFGGIPLININIVQSLFR